MKTDNKNNNENIGNKSNSNYHVDNFFKLTVDLLCIADFNGYFVLMNPQWERILGWSESELKSRPFIEFVHPEDRESTIKEIQKLQKGTKVITFENRYLCKDNSYKWLSWNAIGVVNKQEIYAVARDITKTKTNELTFQKNNLLLKALDKAQSQYITNVDHHKLFDELLSNLLKLTDSEYGFIGEVLYTEDKKPYLKTHAITNIAWNKETRKFYNENAPQGMEFFNLESLFWSVMTTGKPVIANDPANDPRRGGLPEGHPALNHFLGLPFYMGNEFVGMVGIANKPGGYESELIDYLKPFLSTCANLIDGYRNVKERRKAIQALSENEERIRALVNTVIDGIITIDNKGLIETFNPAAGKIFGYHADEVIGKNVKLLMPEPYQSEHDNYIKKYIKTSKAKIIGVGREVDGKRKDGTIFPIDLAVSEMQIGTKRLFIGIVRDITERRKAEKALRESEERWQFALEGSGDGIWDWNIQTNEVFFSKQWKEMLGFEEDEISNKLDEWEKRTHPDDIGWVTEEIQKHFRGEIPVYVSEHRVLCKDGAYKWILDRGKVITFTEDGKPLRMVGTHTDITERKKAEEMHIQLLNQLNTILISVGDAILCTDENLRITIVNPAFVELIGKEENEIIGKNCDDVFNCFNERGEVLCDSECSLKETLDKGINTVSKTIIKNSEGKKITIQSLNSPLRNAEGKITGAVKSIRDISKEAEIDRMKSEFISTVSHELRTPLTSIKGYVDLILDGDTGEINETQKEFLEVVAQNSDRLNNLINDLLDVERIESGKVEMKLKNISLTDTVNTAVKTMEAASEKKGLKLISKIEKGIELYGDSDRVIQALTNLISNAIKFTKEGEIAVELKSVSGEPEISVRDTGIGISKADRKKLFEKFFRADNEYTKEVGGTGLGLSIVKTIVEKHGGEIGVESKINEGSTFTIKFPVKRIEELKEFKILIVDDSKSTLHLLKSKISNYNPKYSVSLAKDGFETAELLNNFNPDLVLLDINIPGIDGFEVCRKIKSDKRTSRTNVVIMTGLEEEDLEGRAYEAGASEFLRKPIKDKILYEVIDRFSKK